MKNHVRLITILAIITLSSCSIQKRVHKSGYHIEWNRKYSSHNKNAFKNQELVNVENPHYDSSTTSSITDKEINYSENTTLSLSDSYSDENNNSFTTQKDEDIFMKNRDETPERIIATEKLTTKRIFQSISVKNITKKKDKINQPEKADPVSGISFALSLIGVLIGAFVSLLAGAIICGVAFNLGIIGLIITVSNSHRYSGKVFSIIGLTLGLLGGICFLLLLILIMLI
jgi:hypothetical protein